MLKFNTNAIPVIICPEYGTEFVKATHRGAIMHRNVEQNVSVSFSFFRVLVGSFCYFL